MSGSLSERTDARPQKPFGNRQRIIGSKPDGSQYSTTGQAVKRTRQEGHAQRAGALGLVYPDGPSGHPGVAGFRLTRQSAGGRVPVNLGSRLGSLPGSAVAGVISSLGRCFRPRPVFILGGNVSQDEALLLVPLRQQLDGVMPSRSRLVPSQLGDAAVLMG